MRIIACSDRQCRPVCRMFSYSYYAQYEYNMQPLETAMPILHALGPSTAHQSLPLRGTDHSAARRWGALPTPSVEWSLEVERETAHLYERIKAVVPAIEWPFFAPYVKAINAL